MAIFSSFKTTIAKAPKKPKKQKIVKPKIAHPKIRLRITNVTATAKLGVTLDLIHVSECLVCMYNHRRFPNCVFQMKNPKCTILLYESGNVVTIGSKTHHLAKTSLYLIMEELEAKLPPVMTFNMHIYDFRVVNYVGSFCVGYLLDLPFIKKVMPKIKYNKYHFPAAIKKTDTKKGVPKGKLTMFDSGEVNIAGAKTPQALYDIYQAERNLRNFKLE